MKETMFVPVGKYELSKHPKLIGYWRSPHGMYRYGWYEKPTKTFKFAAWMLGWKWEDA